jgi:hypothetical protein
MITSEQIFSRDRILAFLVGALAVAAIFLVEAGLSEIVLARDAECIEAAERMRFGPPARLSCLPELVTDLLRAVSRGFIQVAAPGAADLVAWIGMALFYAIVGGTISQLSFRWAVSGYLALHLLVVLVVGSIGYLSRYIL